MVNVSSGSNGFNGGFSSSNLLLSGGSFVGSGAVVGGTATWSGGTFNGTWGVGAGQTLRATTGANKFLEGTTTVLTNQGTIAWNTGDTLFLQNGATLRNQALFLANSSASVVYNGGATPGFENTGTVRAATGVTLTISGGTGFVNNAGTLDALAGALIRYNGATFNAGTQFTGAGSNVAGGSNGFNGSISSTNLVLESGTHIGGGAVVNGQVSWTGGDLTGSWTVGSGQTLNGNAGVNKFVQGGSTVLTNQGTLAWNTGDTLYLQSGGTLRNQGLFVANASTSVSYNGGAATSFENTGTVRAAGGVTLNFNAGAGFVNNGGTLQALTGASIRYSGSTFNAGTQFTGAGSNVANGNNSFNGSLNSANLVLEGGSHSGNAAVVNGQASWTGGTIDGGWTVASGQTLTGNSGPGNKFISGGSTAVVNQGTFAWNTTDSLYLLSGAALRNQALFVANANATVSYNGGAGPVFENTATGTVRAAAGKTLTIGSLTGFVNNGGTLDAQAGGSIVYNGDAVFNTGTTFTGAGSNVAVGNNAYNGSITSANLVLQSGTHSGTAAVLAGNTAFSGGTLAGNWTVGAGQTLRGETGGNKFLTGTVLSNQGTIAWNTGDLIYLQSGAAFNNQGTLNFNAGGGVAYNGGAAPSFVNTGLIANTSSATTTLGTGTGFVNQGTVDVQQGTLVLPTNFTNNGTLKGAGTFNLSGTLTNAGTVAPGASPGTLTLVGNYAQAAAGSFAVELQTLALHDLFNISGTAALNGTLALSCFANCSYAVGDVVTILDSVGDLSGTFSNISLNGFASGAFTVIYDTVADRVQLQVTQAVTAAVPESGTWALMLAGLGVMGWLARRRA